MRSFNLQFIFGQIKPVVHQMRDETQRLILTHVKYGTEKCPFLTKLLFVSKILADQNYHLKN